MTVLEALSCDGWRLNRSALEHSGKLIEGNYKSFLNWALNEDLTDIGEKYIQEIVSSSKDGLLVGPCVLQVSKIRNVSAPKENEYSNVAPRMLKLTLTDGSSAVNAIELEPTDQISLKTPPGTKVKLIGSTAYSSGLLQLQPSCIKVLGGKVEKLYTKWKIACDAGLSRAGINDEGCAPPFVAFGKRVENFNTRKLGINSVSKVEESDKTNSEFDEQRKAAIAEIGNAQAVDKKFDADARANFGRRLDMELTNAKKSFSNQPSRRQIGRAAKPATESDKTEFGLYRELSTDSGQNVHQKTAKEFEEMGFKHNDVILCMRKANNDFEVAMDLLLNMPDTSNPCDDKRGVSIKSGTGRGGRRGRGRGRFMPENDNTDAQISNPATLFDFLESKMSNVFVDNDLKHDQSKRGHRHMPDNVPPPRSSFGDGGRGRGRNDYAREFQSVTHGQGVRNSDEQGRFWYRRYGNDGESKSQTTGKAHNGYGGNETRERLYPTTQRNRSYFRDDGGNKTKQGQYQPSKSNRGGHSDAKAGQSLHQPPKQDRVGHPDETSSGNKSGQGQLRNRGGGFYNKHDDKASQHLIQTLQGNRGDFHDDQYNAGKTKPNQYQQSQRNRGGHPGDRHSGSKAGQRQHQPFSQENKCGPPNSRHDRTGQERQASQYNSGPSNTSMSNYRANKYDDRRTKVQQRESGRFPSNFEEQCSSDGQLQRSDQRSEQIEQCMQPQSTGQSALGFADIHINPPPPQREPTTFGQPQLLIKSNQNSDFHQRHFLPHSITDVQHDDTQMHVTLPQWQIKSECLAKYWEDSQYYRAVIADLHDTAPTAVVRFTDFGNYEEVQLFDLKPLVQTIVPPTTHSNANSMAPPDSRTAEQRNPRRSARPPIALYVPPKNREV